VFDCVGCAHLRGDGPAVSGGAFRFAGEFVRLHLPLRERLRAEAIQRLVRGELMICHEGSVPEGSR
jgi:hypothetical protein